MTPVDKLKSILDKSYTTEDDDSYKVELLSPMTDEEITQFKNQLPNQHLPKDIVDLLKFCRGFEFAPLEQITFDTLFGFEEVFPCSIQLAGDGFGNFWVLDIDSEGNWGNVYYVCHDPPVVVKHSDNLADFIADVSEYGELGSNSKLDTIHEKTVIDIWQEKLCIVEKCTKDDYGFGQIELPEMFMIADLSDVPLRTGFAWGKFGPKAKIIRPSDKPIWVIEKKIRQGFFARLFTSKKPTANSK